MAGIMKTYWLTDCEGRPSVKGQVTLPQSIVAQDVADQRRGSNVSRNYSPITFEDVARRSLTNTPTPSLTPAAAALPPPPTNQIPPPTPTTNNQIPHPPPPTAAHQMQPPTANSHVALPIIDGLTKPSPTEEAQVQIPTAQELMERVRSTTHEKPPPTSLNHHHQQNFNHKPFVNNTSNPTQPQRQNTPLPDVLIDNHYTHNDTKTGLKLPHEVVKVVTPLNDRVVHVGGSVEMVDRGTSPECVHIIIIYLLLSPIHSSRYSRPVKVRYREKQCNTQGPPYTKADVIVDR
ncbi:hypothetical protein Hamer_G017089 [Homarus americanus]|uniref:Uncharacterized protein n=1 Tax=Homarus americanus TaxID=6706 RepID=A0A8J5MX69_HOMAM|nr:hypothetical protein Hamer_G017089 [Homarus americanus]